MYISTTKNRILNMLTDVSMVITHSAFTVFVSLLHQVETEWTTYLDPKLQWQSVHVCMYIYTCISMYTYLHLRTHNSVRF
jgi:hypothetical protein